MTNKNISKIKSVITTVVLVMVIIAVIALSLQVFGQGKVKPSEWFKKVECVHEYGEDGKCTKCGELQPVDDKNLFVTQKLSKGIKLMTTQLTSKDYEESGIEAQDSGTLYIEKKITAEVNPANAVIDLIWSIGFANPNSTWASGKLIGQYCSYVDAPNDSLSKIIICRAAFGEPIELKATSKTDPNVFATCQIDYAKRLSDVYLSGKVSESKPANDPFHYTYVLTHDETSNVVNGISMLPLFPETDTSAWSNFNERAEFNYIYGMGTVAGTVIKTKLEVKASEQFLNIYKTGSYYASAGECDFKDWYECKDLQSGNAWFCYGNVITTLGKSFPICDPDYGSPNEAAYGEFLAALKTYNTTTNIVADFTVRVTVTMQYGDNQVDEEFLFPCAFDRTSYAFRVNSINLPENVTI